jgi:hypothetical protein
VRERREDLPVLVAHLIGRANRGPVRGLAPACASCSRRTRGRATCASSRT